MEKLIIIGTGGLARELTCWCQGHFQVVGYSSLDAGEHAAFRLSCPLYPDEITPGLVGTDKALIAISSPVLKERLCNRLAQAGFVFPTFVHPSALVADSALLGEGVVVAPNCVLGSNVRVGRSAYLNFAVGLGHDADIGDFVQINPGVQVGGWVKIGKGTLIGSNASLIERLTVGEHVTIASGAACFGSIRDSATVMGNPARRMRAFE